MFGEPLRSRLRASVQWVRLAPTSAVGCGLLRAHSDDDDPVGRERQSAGRGRGRPFLPSAHTEGRRSDSPEQRDLVPGLHDIRPIGGRLRAVRVLSLGHGIVLQEQPAAHKEREVASDSPDHRALHHPGRGLPADRPEQVRRDRRGGVAERDRRHRRTRGVAERPHPDDPAGHGLHRGRRPGGGHLRPGRLHRQQGRLRGPQVAGALRVIAPPRRQLLVQHLPTDRPGRTRGRSRAPERTGAPSA